MKLTLWRSVRRAHAATAFTGEGAARFPGRYNAAGVRAVYLADCPSGCALEIMARYAAPEAIRTQMLFEVAVDAPLVDLRSAQMQKRYGFTWETDAAADDYEASRRVAARLLAEKRAGAVVPSATVARAFNVVVYPDNWNRFVVRGPEPLALDRRLVRLVRSAGVRDGRG